MKEKFTEMLHEGFKIKVSEGLIAIGITTALTLLTHFGSIGWLAWGITLPVLILGLLGRGLYLYVKEGKL